MSINNQQIYNLIDKLDESQTEALFEYIKKKRDEKRFLEWRKNLENKGTEDYNLSDEEKKQLSCTEYISWEELKKQHGIN